MKKAIATAILLCLAAILFGTLFISNALTALANVYFEQGVTERMGAQIVVKEPGNAQVEGDLIEADAAITAVVPYYLFTCDVKTAGGQITETIVLLDDLTDVTATPYNNTRLVEGELKTGNTVAVVDYALAQKRGIAVGDSLDIFFGMEGKFVTFTVCAITETNPMQSDNGSMLIAYAGTQKEIVTAARKTPLRYSGAYLQSNDPTATLENLKNSYKPEGTRPTPDEFINYGMYEDYLAIWEAKDHSNMVENVSDYADKALLESGESSANTARIALCAILVGVALSLEIAYFFFNRSRIRRDVERLSFAGVMRRHANPLQPILNAVLCTAAVLLSMFLTLKKLTAFYPVGKAVSFVLPIAGVGIAAAVLSYAVAILLLKRAEPKVMRKKNSYAKEEQPETK